MKLLEVDITIPINNELEFLIVNTVFAHFNEHGVFPNLKELSKSVSISARTIQRKLISENNAGPTKY